MPDRSVVDGSAGHERRDHLFSGDWIAPMLATPGALPGDDRPWSHEFKWDGVRAVTQIHNGAVAATSRNRKDLLGRFPELAAGHDATLDDEIVAPDATGRPDFGRQQHRIGEGLPGRAGGGQGIAVTYLVFDLLYLDGR